MAKKQKKDNNLVGCIIYILMVIATIVIISVQLIPILAPPAFIICALVYWIMYIWKDRPHVKAEFQLSVVEKSRKYEAGKKYIWAKDKLEECEQIIQNEGLRRNANGRLSQRSYRGQEVQGAIDNATKIKEENYPIWSYYDDLPMKRYKKAKKHFSRYWAFLGAFIIWAVMLAILPRTEEMIAYHLDQTGDAINVIWRTEHGMDTTHTDNNSNVDEATPQKAESNTPTQKPSITIWELFFIDIGIYLIVLIIANINFSKKYHKPQE